MPPARLGRDKEVDVQIRVGMLRAVHHYGAPSDPDPTHMERNPTRRRRRRSRVTAHFTCRVCKHVHRKERKSQHLMPDGQSLGIAATTIFGGCPVYAASQGILAFILNLDNSEQSTMGMIRSSFSFLLGTGCGIYIAQNYKEAHKYLAVCSKAHRRNLQET
ncbi:hypothetical protein C4D60_Mb09t02890 [Musa balbisiana]|uniref:Uncharacterized protein n=1 Tax=Musa balbisiana TaxID=52838 RepID=A0A4S8IDK7_MUSBA|nr:hypothetical protein C4D60_Mb09t02890 [Musa balbisiana]